MSSLIPPRPGSVGVTGTFGDEASGSITVSGRLHLPDDNHLILEGEFTWAESGSLPHSGCFLGRTADGATIRIDHAEIASMKASGPIRLRPNSPVVWRAATVSTDTEVTTPISVAWTLTHAPILWRSARKFYLCNGERMEALGLDPETIWARSAARESKCRWEIDGAVFEIGFHEEDHPVPPHPGHLPMAVTRFVPRLTARWADARRTGAEMLACIAAADQTAERLLEVVSFLGGSRVVWFERVEEAVSENPTGPPWRTVHHRVGQLRPGQVPEPGGDTRGFFLAGTLTRTAGIAQARLLAEGAPVESAIESFLLAREARQWPARLSLLSTALEAMNPWRRSVRPVGLPQQRVEERA